MTVVRPLWQDTKTGKGFGLFFSHDLDASDLIFIEPGFAIVTPEPGQFGQPFLGPEILGEDGFADLCTYVSDEMNQRIMNRKADNTIPLVLRTVTDPHQIESLIFNRAIRIHRPFLDAVLKAIMRVTQFLDDAESQVRETRLVARFFQDARVYGNNMLEEKMCGFGVLTGLVNHSCQPNAELFFLPGAEKPNQEFTQVGVYSMRTRPLHVFLQATRPIKAGEEITVAYDNDLFGGNREDRLQSINEKYGFTCRCDSCVAEENDKALMRLKDDVLRLLSDLEDWSDRNIHGPVVYRKAAYILDGFAELGLDHSLVLDVWDICEHRAWVSCDMLRAHWFCTKAIGCAERMYGRSAVPERPRLSLAYEHLKRIQDGVGLAQTRTEGYSVVPEAGYDMNQDGLEELMFALNHDDLYYHCLEVVDGKVREIDDDENEERLGRIYDERKREMDIAEAEAGKKPLHQKTIDELMAEDFGEEPGTSKPRKKSAKQRKKARANTDGLSMDEREALDGLINLAQAAQETATPLRFTIKFDHPFVSRFGAPNATSKQAWLADVATKEAVRVDRARDIGYLLAAKDGYAVQNEGYVLSARRDSVCGRVEGERKWVELRGLAARRARTHSFGNDGGRKDLLKEADVRESKEF